MIFLAEKPNMGQILNWLENQLELAELIRNRENMAATQIPTI